MTNARESIEQTEYMSRQSEECMSSQRYSIVIRSSTLCAELIENSFLYARSRVLYAQADSQVLCKRPSHSNVTPSMPVRKNA